LYLFSPILSTFFVEVGFNDFNEDLLLYFVDFVDLKKESLFTKLSSFKNKFDFDFNLSKKEFL